MAITHLTKPQKVASNRSDRQVRILVEGHTGSGRDILRGVIRFIRTVKPPWRIHVEPRPWLTRGPDWKLDDGTICAVADGELVARLTAENHPLVNCLSHYEHLGIPTVRTDDLAIGRLAAKHLLTRGFERFVFWSDGDRSAAATMRQQGMREVLARAGYTLETLPSKWRQGAEVPKKKGFQLASELRKIGFPVAMLCSHDAQGRSTSIELAAEGIAVPEQVALLGVDNDQLECEISTPMLSSIDLPYNALGYEAAARLHLQLEGKPLPAGAMIFGPLGVVERQSTDVVAVADPVLASAAAFIRAHACDPCTVDDVVNHIGTSRRWLEIHFVARFSRTPHEEISRVRMERAKYLLRTSSMSVQIIAAHCGYGMVQNFGRAFRENQKETPAAYRTVHTPASHTPAKGLSR